MAFYGSPKVSCFLWGLALFYPLPWVLAGWVYLNSYRLAIVLEHIPTLQGLFVELYPLPWVFGWGGV